MGQKIIGICIAIAVLYFGLQASNAVEYFANLAQYLDKKDDGTAIFMRWLFRLTPIALTIITIGIVIAALLPEPEDFDGPGVSLLLWGGLGWWVGSRFNEAWASKQACLSNSVFGFGCNLDGPILSYFSYAIVSIYLAFQLVLFVLAGVSQFGAKKEEIEEAAILENPLSSSTITVDGKSPEAKTASTDSGVVEVGQDKTNNLRNPTTANSDQLSEEFQSILVGKEKYREIVDAIHDRQDANAIKLIRTAANIDKKQSKLAVEEYKTKNTHLIRKEAWYENSWAQGLIVGAVIIFVKLFNN